MYSIFSLNLMRSLDVFVLYVCVLRQIAISIPLVSDRQDLSVLQSEYAEEDTIYQLKIKVMTKSSSVHFVTICNNIYTLFDSSLLLFSCYFFVLV